MWARLKVLVSSRHNGPAFIAANTNSMVEKAVPISAAAVSVPGFGVRFNDIASSLSDRTVARQLPTRNTRAKSVHRIRAEFNERETVASRRASSSGFAGGSPVRLQRLRLSFPLDGIRYFAQGRDS
jgi:hypothetical protein